MSQDSDKSPSPMILKPREVNISRNLTTNEDNQFKLMFVSMSTKKQFKPKAVDLKSNSDLPLEKSSEKKEKTPK
jgi:hypothetical protein